MLSQLNPTYMSSTDTALHKLYEARDNYREHLSRIEAAIQLLEGTSLPPITQGQFGQINIPNAPIRSGKYTKERVSRFIHEPFNLEWKNPEKIIYLLLHNGAMYASQMGEAVAKYISEETGKPLTSTEVKGLERELSWQAGHMAKKGIIEMRKEQNLNVYMITNPELLSLVHN